MCAAANLTELRNLTGLRSTRLLRCSVYAIVVLSLRFQFLRDPMLKPLLDDDYVAFGLACCFVMNDNLKLDGEPRTVGVETTLPVESRLQHLFLLFF